MGYFRPSILGGGKLARLVVTYPAVEESRARYFYNGLVSQLLSTLEEWSTDIIDGRDAPPEFQMTKMNLWVLPHVVVTLTLSEEKTRDLDLPPVAVAYGDPKHDPISRMWSRR